jgi:hypothetical protein
MADDPKVVVDAAKVAAAAATDGIREDESGWDFLVRKSKGLATNFIMNVAADGVGSVIVNHAKKATEKSFTVPRDVLFQDLAEMAIKDANDTVNIWAHHAEATAKHTENKLMRLLCCATAGIEEPAKRQEILKYLNGLTDKLFWQEMYSLDNDVVKQFAERAWDHAKHFLGFLVDLGEPIPPALAALRSKALGIAQRINEAAERNAPAMRRAADSAEATFGPGRFGPLFGFDRNR